MLRARLMTPVSPHSAAATSIPGFRDIKSGDLDVRPIHHRRAHRVRAHVFLGMLAH